MRTLMLFLMNLLVLGAGAEDLVVENDKITLPSMIIRGNYDEVIAKQKFVLGIFFQLVARSPYELDDIKYTTTEDGFLTGIVPIYSRESKTPGTQYRVLIFTQDTIEMRTFLERGGDALLQMVLRNEERAGDMWLASRTLGGKETPIFIWIKTKSNLIST